MCIRDRFGEVLRAGRVAQEKLVLVGLQPAQTTGQLLAGGHEVDILSLIHI